MTLIISLKNLFNHEKQILHIWVPPLLSFEFFLALPRNLSASLAFPLRFFFPKGNMNYSKIMCPTNQTMRIKKTIKYMILSPKKKKEKKNRFSGKANKKLYNSQKQKLTWQVKGLIKNWLSRFRRKKYPEKLIYLNSYKSKQKKAY